MEGRIHSFESFGTVDGPGVRFVIFMQGCTMRCQYCHNPDTWLLDGGHTYESDDIIKEILKYRNYIENGGVTLTGGEPLLQLDFVIELLTKLKALHIHTCVDTSGIVFCEEDKTMMNKLNQLLDVCDLFLLDIKHIDDTIHQQLTGKSNQPVLAFAKYLDNHHKAMWIRHVLVDTWSDQDEYLYALRAFLDTLHHVEKIEVLPYHAMGEVKYEALQIPYRLKGMLPPSHERIANAIKILGCDRYE